jgi:hypothetical protein
MTAETIRNEYYYDESAGIRSASRRPSQRPTSGCSHQRDRLGLARPDGHGPIGVGVAVVRGHEMYVATVGPAEAYLIHQARLLDAARPAPGARPAHRGPGAGRLARRDLRRRLARPRVAERRRPLGPDAAQGRHAHAAPAVGDGAPPRTGSWRRTVPAATARSRSRRRRWLHVTRPDARAGAAGGAARRDPRPLADPARRQRPGRRSRDGAAAGTARTAAGGVLEKVVGRVQEFMPQRRPAYRRVTRSRPGARPSVVRRSPSSPSSSSSGAWDSASTRSAVSGHRRGDQLGHCRTACPRCGTRQPDEGEGPGDRPRRGRSAPALQLLTEAYEQLRDRRGGRRRTVRRSHRCVRRRSRDSTRLYGVVPVASSALFTFEPPEDGDPIDLTADRPRSGRRAVRPRRGHQDRLPDRPEARRRQRPIAALRAEGGRDAATPTHSSRSVGATC